MVTIHITAELHAELKAESKRKNMPISQLIGQIRLERERLKELAANIQYLKVDDEFGVVSDITNELIKVKCVERLKLD
jgi:predicted DNA-binding ribbon-helix-helix protein